MIGVWQCGGQKAHSHIHNALTNEKLFVAFVTGMQFYMKNKQ